MRYNVIHDYTYLYKVFCQSHCVHRLGMLTIRVLEEGCEGADAHEGRLRHHVIQPQDDGGKGLAVLREGQGQGGETPTWL